jgi:hypothetical protein
VPLWCTMVYVLDLTALIERERFARCIALYAGTRGHAVRAVQQDSSGCIIMYYTE